MKFESEYLPDGSIRCWVKYEQPVGMRIKDWKITQRIANIDMQVEKLNRKAADRRVIIDCLKRNFVQAAAYYETDEFNLMQGSQMGMALAKIMRREIGYSEGSFWWDIVHKRLDLYKIAKNELRYYKFLIPEIQQALDFLDARDKENLTRGTTKGITMHPDQERRPGDIRGAETCTAEKPMTLSRHKKIYDLAYKLKATIDKELGKEPLQYNEVCMLGEIMQRVIPLK